MFSTVPLDESVPLAAVTGVIVDGEEPETPLRGTVSGFDVGGDDGGPWLATTVRVENATEASAGFPSFELACAGSVEQAGLQAGSVSSGGKPVPGGSFVAGDLLLLIPGDGRFGEPVPECAGPAFVRAGTGQGSQWEVPADVLAELNAAAVKFNAEP